MRTVTAFAPGRVNLIGDHTDYMGGPCLPFALQYGTTVSVSTDDTGRRAPAFRATSADGYPDGVLDMTIDWEMVDDPVLTIRSLQPDWFRYVAAVAWGAGRLRDDIPRTEISVTSNLPAEAGLSSSAALEVALALAFEADGDQLALAKLAQQAEHHATGMPSGILDQMSSLFGKAGHAIVLDCTRLTAEQVRIPAAAQFTVIHSEEPRKLADSAYSERRAQCEAAAAIIGPLPQALRADVDTIDDPLIARRARHVITECARVRDAVVALDADDLERVGQLMADSHRSMSEDFEVSTPGIDQLVDTVSAHPGVYGARLTGGGFGGCIVALHQPDIDWDAVIGTERRRWAAIPSDGAQVS